MAISEPWPCTGPPVAGSLGASSRTEMGSCPFPVLRNMPFSNTTSPGSQSHSLATRGFIFSMASMAATYTA